MCADRLADIQIGLESAVEPQRKINAVAHSSCQFGLKVEAKQWVELVIFKLEVVGGKNSAKPQVQLQITIVVGQSQGDIIGVHDAVTIAVCKRHAEVIEKLVGEIPQRWQIHCRSQLFQQGDQLAQPLFQTSAHTGEIELFGQPQLRQAIKHLTQRDLQFFQGCTDKAQGFTHPRWIATQGCLQEIGEIWASLGPFLTRTLSVAQRHGQAQADEGAHLGCVEQAERLPRHEA